MDIDATARARLNELAVERMPCGVFAVDRQFRLTLWNRFMADRSGVSADAALGKLLFDLFPDLPGEWLRRKFEAVFLLKIGTFTSWEHRPYLFRLTHDRPITGDIDWMRQDCAFVPLMEGAEVSAVCVTVTDVTDLALAQRAREDAVTALQEASIRDSLTGLYNRRHIEDRLGKEFCLWRRCGRAFCVLILDLDYFKGINDAYGHSAGDTVLKAVAASVASCLRAHDIFGRYGGEEFIVLLPDTNLADAAIVGERIRLAIEAVKVPYGGREIGVTTSIGMAQVRAGTINHDEVVCWADGALYEAKANGRNRLAVS